MRFLKIILLENYPKNCCQFRGVASVRSSNREIEEGLGGVEAIKTGRWSDDALTTAPS